MYVYIYILYISLSVVFCLGWLCVHKGWASIQKQMVSLPLVVHPCYKGKCCYLVGSVATGLTARAPEAICIWIQTQQPRQFDKYLVCHGLSEHRVL